MVYLHNVNMILFELLELPSLFDVYYMIVKDTLIDKYIGKNFEAPKKLQLLGLRDSVYD